MLLLSIIVPDQGTSRTVYSGVEMDMVIGRVS